MIIETKIECECVRDFYDDGRSCENNITKECLEASENGRVCELLCVNKVIHYEKLVDKLNNDEPSDYGRDGLRHVFRNTK